MCLCADGFYPDVQTGACNSCEPLCRTCNGPTEEDCTACFSSRLLQAGECVRSCQSGFYLNEQTSTCDQCDNTCLSCDGPGSNQCSSCASNRLSYRGQCLEDCPEGTIASGNACERAAASCPTTATVNGITRGAPTSATTGSPSVDEYLCASGTSGSRCVIEGGQIDQSISTSFTLQARVQCTVQCSQTSSRDFSQRFNFASRVTRKDYRLISVISTSNVDLITDARSVLTSSSQQLSEAYTEAETMMRSTIAGLTASICSGQTSSGAAVTLSRRDVELSTKGDAGEEGLCSVAYLTLLPTSLIQSRCVCDDSVDNLQDACAQVPGNGPEAMCHPDQCVSPSAGSVVISLVIDESYSSFSDSRLKLLANALSRQIAQLLGVNSAEVKIFDVQPVIPSIAARFVANYQTLVRFTVVGISESQMDEVATALSSGQVDLGVPVLAAQGPGDEKLVPAPPSTNPTNVPVPTPVYTPVYVPNPVPVNNPIPNPVPVSVPVRVPVPVPVQVPVPVPVPVPVNEDDAASSAIRAIGVSLLMLLVLIICQ